MIEKTCCPNCGNPDVGFLDYPREIFYCLSCGQYLPDIESIKEIQNG